MALIVCCPCGNPLECENLDLIVTLPCPKCKREIAIELEDARKGSYRAVLTVMAGPYWVGEQFVMPIGQDLFLGKSMDNWLSLESDRLADRHCRMKVDPDGQVEIEDLGAEDGTWIGQSSVLKGRLQSEQSFEVGEYRFRLDLQAVGGDTASASMTRAGPKAATLPALKHVGLGRSRGDWLVRNRFQVTRWLVVSFAWPIAIYHTCALRGPPGPQPWYLALPAGALILGGLVFSARLLNMAHHVLRFVALGALVLLAIADMVWGKRLPAIPALLVGAAYTLFTALSPSRGLATLAAVVGGIALTFTAILALIGVVSLIG